MSGDSSSTLLLSSQIHAQQTIQRLIYENQHPSSCTKARILRRKPLAQTKDGFALEAQYMAWLLQTAIATQRTLVIAKHFQSAYAPQHCLMGETEENRTGWHCLWENPSLCTVRDAFASAEGAIDEKAPNTKGKISPLRSGLIVDRDESTYFDVQFYGPTRTVDAHRTNPHGTFYIDILPHYERAFGR